MTLTELRTALLNSIQELDHSIRVTKSALSRRSNVFGDHESDPYTVTDPNGRYILLDALAARANLLAALVNLEVAGVK